MAAWTNVVVLQVLRNGQIVEYLEDPVDGVLFCFFTDCMWGVGERSQGWFQHVWLNNWENMAAICGGDQELGFGHIMFGMSTRYPPTNLLFTTFYLSIHLPTPISLCHKFLDISIFFGVPFLILVTILLLAYTRKGHFWYFPSYPQQPIDHQVLSIMPLKSLSSGLFPFQPTITTVVQPFKISSLVSEHNSFIFFLISRTG